MVNTVPSLTDCGTIEDIELGLKWDPATLASKVHRRVALLSQMGIGRGSLVAMIVRAAKLSMISPYDCDPVVNFSSD